MIQAAIGLGIKKISLEQSGQFASSSRSRTMSFGRRLQIQKNASLKIRTEILCGENDA